MGNASMSFRHLATLGIGAASLVLACSPGKLTGESGPPSGGSATDTLFADTFESGALGDPGRWHDIVGNGASIVSAAAEGISAVSGTKVLKLRADGVGIEHAGIDRHRADDRRRVGGGGVDDDAGNEFVIRPANRVLALDGQRQCRRAFSRGIDDHK